MKKIPKSNHKIIIFIITIVAILLIAILLVGSNFSTMLLGFGITQPNSIEVIRYDWPEGTEKTIVITDREEILELYDAIRHAKIQQIQIDSEGLETDGDWEIILHFTDEDIYMSTQGEGMKDSIYFRRYVNQSVTDDFIEIWLDNSNLVDILNNYE